MSKRNPTKKTLDKYRQVVDEWFVNGFNGKQAYLKYYPNSKDETATTNFSKLQQISEISLYIDSKKEEAAKIVNTTHEGILQELVNWVSSDITETMNLTPEEVKELPIALKRLITKYKTTSRNIYNGKGEVIEKVETVELHFVSKERAIEMINKHVGFYEVDNQQKATTINITTTNEAHKKIVDSIVNSGD